MRPLFVRVFLSFLFSMAAAAITFTIVLGAMRRDTLQASWSKISSGALAAVAQTAADDWQDGHTQKADAYVAGVERLMGLDLVLFSGDGQPITGRRRATEAEIELARAAFTQPDADMVLTPPRLTGAFVVSNAAAHRRFVLLAHVHGNLATNLVPPILRLSIAVLVVGLVTYALARSITDPILMLRRATARLAGGDLSARVANAAPLSRRKDEIGALGRDFDRMADRVESAMLAQTRLLADISHELRSPLTRLSVAVALARQRRVGDDALLNRIEREASRMDELIEGLLTISRLNSPDKLTTEPLMPIDFVRLVRDVCQDADYEAMANDRRCIVEAPASMPSIPGDIELLHRAIENVTRNAIRYTTVGTSVEVTLSASKDQEFGILRVHDHGPGVPDDVLPDLFRPFYRVAEARDRASGGTGLGLAIADRAVRYHGGEIYAENAVDGGLVITITLPLSGKPPPGDMGK